MHHLPETDLPKVHGIVRIFLLAAVQKQGRPARHRCAGLCRAKISGGTPVLAQDRFDFWFRHRPPRFAAGRLGLVCVVRFRAASVFFRAFRGRRPRLCRRVPLGRQGSARFPARRHAGALRPQDQKTNLVAGADHKAAGCRRGEGGQRSRRPRQCRRRICSSPKCDDHCARGENRFATGILAARRRPGHLGRQRRQARALRLGHWQGGARNYAAGIRRRARGQRRRTADDRRAIRHARQPGQRRFARRKI